MSGLPSVFQVAHFCPVCRSQCACLTAELSAGPEEEEIVFGCTHDCGATRRQELEEQLARDGTYKPGHSGGFPF
jgi:hypothetical protein